MPECWASLDELPIYTWWKLHETGNVRLLLKDNKTRVGWIRMRILENLWYNLVNEYVKCFGFSEQYRRIIRAKKELAHHYIKRIIGGDKTEQVFINILEQEIKEMESELNTKESDNYQMLFYLNKSMNVQINVRTTSVKEYMNFVKAMESQMAA